MRIGKFTLGLIAAASIAVAQDRRYNGEGYGFFAVGGTDNVTTIGYGAGGTGLVYKGLGVGADIGWLHPSRSFSDGFGMFSVNPSWHFVNRDHPAKITPFVTAGYTLAFRSGTANMWNWGGGATFWLNDRVGLRLELRDHLIRGERFNTSFRIGVSFR